MKIDRAELIANLHAFVTEGHGLVIGQPGVGKTHTLLALCDSLKQAETRHLLVPVESLGDATDADMRDFLRQDGDWIQLLQTANSGASKRAILIFDGFDAARGDKERAAILKLIKRAILDLKDVWNVVVSVRTFDAEKSHKLLDLFPDKTAALKGQPRKTRAFPIPVLTDTEVAQACTQIDGLQSLLDQGTPELRELLRTPFNLWLVERVLQAMEIAAVSQITSEVELLDLYWTYRVRRTHDRQKRDHLLTGITREMVAQHTLSVRRDCVYTPELDEVWNELLSDEVLSLSPKNEQRVGFTHNILFDFAVSAELLESEPHKLAEFIAQDPARPLFLRPSLVYHFTGLWHSDPQAFWKNFWAVLSRDEVSLRQVVRLVLPSVVVSEARQLADLSPLLERLDNGGEQASEAIAFVMQALRILTSKRDDLWSSFIAAACDRLELRFAWDAGLNILSILEANRLRSSQCILDCNRAGRTTLAWALDKSNSNGRGWLNRLAAFVAIPIVGKTYGADRDLSRAALEPILASIGESNFSIECVHRLIDEMHNLLASDAEFVSQIYVRVFGFEERSEEITQMGGTVMPMSSNRRQDYDLCQYSLTQFYPAFLAATPNLALSAGFESVQLSVIASHVLPYLKKDTKLEDIPQPFRFRGFDVPFINDGSAIWDEQFHLSQEIQIAAKMFAWLADVASAKDQEKIELFLDLMAKKASAAVFWSRLLRVGAKHPVVLAPWLWQLLTFNPILICPDTIYPVSAFLKAAFRYFDDDQRRAVETAILRLPDSTRGGSSDRLASIRDRYLSRLDAEVLVTNEASERRAALGQIIQTGEDDRPVEFTMHSRELTEDDDFKDQGINPNTEPNLFVKSTYHPLKQWADEGKKPELIPTLMPFAAELFQVLTAPANADDPVLAVAWNHLVSFASDAIQSLDKPESEEYTLLRRIILSGATRPEPLYEEDADSKWTSPIWSSAPRNEAAQTAPLLMIHGKDAEALAVITRLAEDKVPSVRFLLFSEIWRLQKTSPDELWTFLSTAIGRERNQVVMQGIALSLWRLSRLGSSRTPELVRALLERLANESVEDDETSATAQLVGIVTDYAVGGAEWATTLLHKWETDVFSNLAATTIAGNRLSQYVVPKASAPQLRSARTLLLQNLEAVATALSRLKRQPDLIPADRRERSFRRLYGVIDQTISRIYFALDVDPALRRDDNKILTDRVRRRFFFDSLPVLDKILSFDEEGFLLAPSAHYFMQLLKGVLRFDPALVLERAAKVVTFSAKFGYNSDAIALKETVELVESLLTDYRECLQQPQSLNHLLDILDAFTAVGWPAALNLVWRLDEIYR